MSSMLHKAASPLLALPAAMSLGVGLAGPAAAQGVISTSRYAPVNLSNYGPGPVNRQEWCTSLFVRDLNVFQDSIDSPQGDPTADTFGAAGD